MRDCDSAPSSHAATGCRGRARTAGEGRTRPRPRSRRPRGCRRAGRRGARGRAARVVRRSAGRPCRARTAGRRRQRTGPTVNSWPTSWLSAIPRVIEVAAMLASGPSGGSKDSQTSASTRVRALPGRPGREGARCRRRGGRPRGLGRRASAYRVDRHRRLTRAQAAIQIASTLPAACRGRGQAAGRASAMSVAAMHRSLRAPPRVATLPSPAGSQTTPDGTPYMTTKRARSPRAADAGDPRARPGEARVGCGDRRTSPMPEAAEPAGRAVQPVAGSSSAASAGSAAGSSSSTVATTGQRTRRASRGSRPAR